MSLSLGYCASLCLLSAPCISVTAVSKGIHCIQSRFQHHQALPPGSSNADENISQRPQTPHLSPETVTLYSCTHAHAHTHTYTPSKMHCFCWSAPDRPLKAKRSKNWTLIIPINVIMCLPRNNGSADSNVHSNETLKDKCGEICER